MREKIEAFKQLLRDELQFFEHASGLCLREYQEGPARAIIESVLQGLGLFFVVVFPRQCGKNELQAQIETYLLTLLQEEEAEMEAAEPKHDAPTGAGAAPERDHQIILEKGKWVYLPGG